MRILALTIAAAFLLLPAPAVKAQTTGTNAYAAADDAKAPAKKHKRMKKAAKKEKVEYMRAAPMPPASK